MPQAIIPDRFIDAFERNITKLEKKYPSVRQDLKDMFKEVAEDYTNRCGGRRVPRLRLPSAGMSIWKYRCGSRDRKRGRSGGFRVIRLLRGADSTMNPIMIFSKARGHIIPKPKQINALIKELEDLDRGRNEAIPLGSQAESGPAFRRRPEH